MDDFADIELKDALVRGQVSEIASWLEVRAPHDIAEEFTRLDAKAHIVDGGERVESLVYIC